jgi:OHCU decarboxylase
VELASTADQLALIQAHPDLAGRAALTGRLGSSSTGEQLAAGLDPQALTAAEIEAFQDGNASYRQRFCFPFVICARENGKEQILARLRERMDHDRDVEMAIALREIGRIAWYRLADVVTAE